ncbi:hypothetical protein [Methanobrevibacter sp. V74]|uniref:hypothetical protein n=1 Tax=Methanobrevibacter sp. V74 TaxID=3064279 RepID=UPI002732A2B0|nr:hypothetical protein [Methanobrevibacter sp. V74]
MMTNIRPPLVNHYYRKKANTNTKTKQESHIEPKNAKTAQYKNIAVKKQRYRIISDYGKHFPKKIKIKMQRKIENQKSPPKKKSTKIRSKKQQKLPFTKHETKHTPNKIHNNRLKTNKYRT